MTVDVPTPATPNQPLGVKEDVKYPAGSSPSTTQNPDYQRWELGLSGLHIPGANNYTVSNAAFPGKVCNPPEGA